MTAKLRKLLEDRANVWSQMTEIMTRSTGAFSTLPAEDRETYAKAEIRLDELTADIEAEQRYIANERTMAEGSPATGPLGGGEDRGSDDERYSRAFNSFIRRGINSVDAEDRALLEARFENPETRAQSSGTTTTGGYSVPQGFWAKVTDTLKAYGGILAVSNILTTDTGNTIPWPTVDDTANAGAILAENVQVTGQDITFGQNTLGAYTYTSKLILASIQFLQDTGIDAEAFLAKKIGQRIGRALSAHLATGTGTGQPQGLTSFATGKTGLAGQTTSVILDDLIDLEYSVDVAYRQAGVCNWVMADSSAKVVRKIKDTTGRPLWEPSLQAGASSTLNGYGLIVDNGMPTMAANAKPIAFGDISSGLVVRQVSGGQLLRLTERYADYLQVGFLGFGRFDARVDDSAAVRLYVNSAT
jgi:HK97 family phage major capsid protein